MPKLSVVIVLFSIFLISSCAQTRDYIENCENTECSENALCEMVDDIPICSCKDGFEGNGIICTKKETFLWKQTIGGKNFEYGYIIIPDKNNNIYIAGSFKGDVDFDSGNGIDIHSSGHICKKETTQCQETCTMNQECNYKTLTCECIKGFHKETITDGEGNDIEKCIEDICDEACNPKKNEICANNKCICVNGYHQNSDLNCVLNFECSTPCREDEICNNGVCECKNGYYKTYLDNSFLTKIKYDGTYLWTKTVFSLNNNKIVDLELKDNFLYLLGTYKGDIDFDPSDGLDIKQGDIDKDKTFLLKLTDTGSYIKTTILETNSPTSITINDKDSLYVTGSFNGRVNFNFDYTGNVFTSVNNSSDIFISKFKTDMSYLWTKTIGSDDWDGAESIAVNSRGDIYIVGGFNNTVDFNPTDGIDEHTSNGNTDIFITKFNSSGIYQWTKTLGSTNYDMVEDIIIDSEDNILIVGSFSDSLAITETEAYESNGLADIFVSKLDENGNFLWTKIFGGPQWETGGSIAVDNLDNVYVIGNFMESIKFDDEIERVSLGGYDIFIAKLDKNGKYLQGRTIGGNDDEIGEAINIDNSDNILLTGYFTDNIILESTTESFTSKGGTDIFIFKIK